MQNAKYIILLHETLSARSARKIILSHLGSTAVLLLYEWKILAAVFTRQAVRWQLGAVMRPRLRFGELESHP